MATITKVYKETVPALRFIGKRYTEADRKNGSFGAKWGEWFDNGWFDVVEKLYDGNLADLHTDGGAYIGLMRDTDSGFEYWIGIFMPSGTAAPEGFTAIDFPAGELGVCWIHGQESDCYKHEAECYHRVKAEGYDISGAWCFERYACPRFTEPDADGNVVLDMCFYL